MKLIFRDSQQAGEPQKFLCTCSRVLPSLSMRTELCRARQADLCTDLWSHKLECAVSSAWGAQVLLRVPRHPAPRLSQLALCSSVVVTDVSHILLEFGTTGQRNNKHSGKRPFGEMQEVVKCPILVNSDAESKVK